MKPDDRFARKESLDASPGGNLRQKPSMLTRATLSIVIFSQTILLAAAADNASGSSDAWTLYSQQKYSASADAFDELIRSSKPNSRLYYYAALANRSSSRMARARQLCKYIVTNFPATTEAAYAQKLYPDSISSASNGLPESMKGKSIQELMKSEEGRKAIEEALAKKESAAVTAKSNISPVLAKSKGGKAGERVFSASDIAKDGANGIDQNPIICGSQYTSGLPHLVVPSHAYTIIDFEPAAGMLKIRNPHGANSQRFSLPNDEHHQKFEQLDDGVFRMHLSLFRLYFSQVARASI